MTRLNIPVTEAMKRMIKIQCAKSGQSIAEFSRTAILTELARRKSQTPKRSTVIE